MFSSTFIHNKPSSSREAKSVISIHDNKPDLRIRDVVIRRLFVRLSKTYLRHKIVRSIIIYQRRKTNRGRASKISFLSARSCRSLWNRLANKSQVCLRLKILHSSSPALSIASARNFRIQLRSFFQSSELLYNMAYNIGTSVVSSSGRWRRKRAVRG
jgi:hypothetical protein